MIEHAYLTDSRGFSIRLAHDTVHIHNWNSIIAGMILRKALTIRPLMPEMVGRKTVWKEM